MMKGSHFFAASAVLTIATALLAGGGFAATDSASHSKYAGQEQREIKSLSQDDMDELMRGGGWGLAKAAELNGMPGPAHLLELKNDIPLTPEQVTHIQSVFDEMKQQAISQGKTLIELERILDQNFRDQNINEADLRSLLAKISKARTELRFTHLRTHLMTTNILSKEQIAHYNTLRGYSSDPCSSIPKGHDPAMWKRHNGCK